MMLVLLLVFSLKTGLIKWQRCPYASGRLCVVLTQTYPKAPTPILEFAFRISYSQTHQIRLNWIIFNGGPDKSDGINSMFNDSIVQKRKNFAFALSSFITWKHTIGFVEMEKNTCVAFFSARCHVTFSSLVFDTYSRVFVLLKCWKANSTVFYIRTSLSSLTYIDHSI